MGNSIKIVLNDVRIEKNLTWLELEDKTGIPARTLINIQHNQSTCLKTLATICNSLKIDITDILRWE
jgi:DNA-binding Xre family transcriptional regulator